MHAKYKQFNVQVKFTQAIDHLQYACKIQAIEKLGDFNV